MRNSNKHTFIVLVIPRFTERKGFVINYVRRKFSDKNVLRHFSLKIGHTSSIPDPKFLTQKYDLTLIVYFKWG